MPPRTYVPMSQKAARPRRTRQRRGRLRNAALLGVCASLRRTHGSARHAHGHLHRNRAVQNAAAADEVRACARASGQRCAKALGLRMWRDQRRSCVRRRALRRPSSACGRRGVQQRVRAARTCPVGADRRARRSSLFRGAFVRRAAAQPLAPRVVARRLRQRQVRAGHVLARVKRQRSAQRKVRTTRCAAHERRGAASARATLEAAACASPGAVAAAQPSSRSRCAVCSATYP